MNTKENAYFCPSCGSPAMNVSSLSGGEATCRGCSWKGAKEEVPTIPFSHDLSSPDQIFRIFTSQIGKFFSQVGAEPIGRVLLQWGFIDRKNLSQELTFYMRRITLATAKAIFEAREELEKKRAEGKDPNVN